MSGNAAVKRNYLETQAKRKLLWGGKKVAEKPTELTDQQKLWANLQVGTDKQTNKFQKVYFTVILIYYRHLSLKNDWANFFNVSI